MIAVDQFDDSGHRRRRFFQLVNRNEPWPDQLSEAVAHHISSGATLWTVVHFAAPYTATLYGTNRASLALLLQQWDEGGIPAVDHMLGKLQ